MVRAHSDLEITLDIMLGGCACGGTVTQIGKTVVDVEGAPHAIVRVQCESCGATGEREYDISTFFDAGDTRDGPLNPTDRPSEILDIVQYAHLARFYLEYVQTGAVELSRAAADNLLRIAEAGAAEAIKHLGDGDEAPPEAVFAADRQMLLETNREAFSRENLALFAQGIAQHRERLSTLYDILGQMTGEERSDNQILENYAAQYKDDPILFPWIGRVAFELHQRRGGHDHQQRH